MAKLVNSKVLKVTPKTAKTSFQRLKPSDVLDAPEKKFSVKSTNLKSFSYDNALRELTVTFLKGNRTYLYADVPSYVYLQMLNANTPGEYFYAKVRLRYKYTEITGYNSVKKSK